MQKHLTKIAAVAFCAVAVTLPSRALVMGPYTPDTNTAFLFHFNEPAGGYVATNAAGSLAAGTNAVAYSTTGVNIFPGVGVNAPTNLTVLGAGGASGFAFGDFGNAANLANVNGSATNGIGVDLNLNGGFALDNSGTRTNDVATNHSIAFGANNAFTLEALINIAGTNGNQEIICTDNGAANNARGFQFRLNGPRMEFFFIGQGAGAVAANDIFATIPSAGAHAFVPNQWFHVALTHVENPVAGGTNSIFYWTALSDSFLAANALSTNTVALVDATDAGLLVIGNEGRSAGSSLGSGEGLQGLIDEARISKVARAANQMLFENRLTITTNPANVIVQSGATATFTVAATTDFTPLSYRWRTNGVPLVNGGSFSGANSNVLQISSISAALASGITYDCMVTNSHSPLVAGVDWTNSTGATVTLYVPKSLKWAGIGSTWDNSNPFWTTNNNVSQLAYTDTDNVTFDDLGSAQPSIALSQILQPSSVTVAGSASYTLNGSGSITGPGSVTMNGSGALSFETDNSYAGGTTISAGTVNVGVGGAAGSLGTGPIANNGALVFNRTSALTVPGNISGGGGITFNGNANITLSGSNSYTADTFVNAGVLTLASTNALGASTNVVVTSTTGGALGGTRIAMGAGFATGTNVALSLPTAGATVRSTLFSVGASAWNGPITINGDGAASPSDQLAFASGGGFMTIGGTVTGVNFPGTLQLRGDGTGSGSAANVTNGFGGILNRTLDLGAGATLQVHDGTTWTINSIGNNWLISEIAKGTMKLTQNNAMPTGVTVRMGAVGNAWLDLAGVNQQIAGLAVVGNVGVITNSSASADSTLTVSTNAGANVYTGTIVDGATRKTSLVNADGTLILNGVNTYSGDTTVSAGTLALTNSGSIGNSASIEVDLGATLDASGKTNGGLTLNVAQTLKGNGTLLGNVFASGTIAPGASIGTLTFSNDLTLNGNLAIEVNKSVSPTNDLLIVSGALTNAGTGQVSVANLGPALVAGNSFKLFSQPVLNGGALTITNGLGAGLAWTNLLAVDGSIAVIASGPAYATNPTNITFTVGGGTLNLSWPADHLGWILQSQTNSRAIGITSGWIDMAGTASITATNLPISVAQPTVFFRLRIP